MANNAIVGIVEVYSDCASCEIIHGGQHALQTQLARRGNIKTETIQ
jgi:hypothetical protein